MKIMDLSEVHAGGAGNAPILGQYLAKTYTEVKKRPIYIARERSIKPFN